MITKFFDSFKQPEVADIQYWERNLIQTLTSISASSISFYTLKDSLCVKLWSSKWNQVFLKDMGVHGKS